MWSSGNSSELSSYYYFLCFRGNALFNLFDFLLDSLKCYFLKGAEDDLRKVTDIAYKQVSTRD